METAAASAASDRGAAAGRAGSSAFRQSPLWWPLCVGAATALLCLPFLRNVYGLGDEGIWLAGADRLLRGRRLYADFFALHPPLGFLLVEGWLAAFGVSLAAARVLTLLTVVGIACATYSCCLEASGRRPYAAAIALGWVVVSQGVWTHTNHHWFTTLFSMLAALSALAAARSAEPRRWHAFAAGLACGAAGMVTPPRGALAAAAAAAAFAALPRRSASLAAFAAGLAVVPAAMLAYLGAQGTLAEAFQGVVVFNATRYGAIQSVPFAAFANGQFLPLAYLYPFIALSAAVLLVRDRRRFLGDRPLRVCAAFAAAGFLGSFPRPDILHVAFAAPLALPLLALCVARLAEGWLTARLWLAVFAGICYGAACYGLDAHRALAQPTAATPRGRMGLVEHPGLREVIEAIAEAPAADSYFFYPYMPLLPFLAGREQVSKHELFLPSYTTPAQYRDACAAVLRDADWVVIDRIWTDAAFIRTIFPAMPDAEPPERMAFERALREGFAPVLRNGSFELRRRREAAADTGLCDALGAR